MNGIPLAFVCLAIAYCSAAAYDSGEGVVISEMDDPVAEEEAILKYLTAYKGVGRSKREAAESEAAVEGVVTGSVAGQAKIHQEGDHEDEGVDGNGRCGRFPGITGGFFPGVGVNPGLIPGVGVNPGLIPGIGINPGVINPGIGINPGVINPGIGINPGVINPGIGINPGVINPGIGINPGVVGFRGRPFVMFG